MRVPRKDPTLNDAIEALDEKFVTATASTKTEEEAIVSAWNSVTPHELEFITGEVDRCIVDRRYYMENYHTIRDESGVVKTMHPLLDQQLFLQEILEREWSAKGCFRGIILKPRQATGTTWSAAIVFHDTIFVPQAYSLSMAQDDDVSNEIYQRMIDSYHNLPWWLRPEYLSKQQGHRVIFQRTDENRRLVDPGMGSTLIVSNSQKSSGIAIGRTIRNIHGSEVSRWADATVWTSDIKPSMNAPDIIAILESTAFGRTGLFWNMWRAAEHGQSIWLPIFIPVYKVRKYFLPVYKSERFTLTAEESALRKAVLARENFKIPLGFFKWRRNDIQETINATGSDETHYEAYPTTPGEAFISSGFCAFPRKELNRQQAVCCRPPAMIGEIEYTSMDTPPILHMHVPTEDELMEKPDRVNRFWVWEEPREGEEYYIGADVASGDAKDFSSAPVYRMGWGSEPNVQVAEWHGHINASHYARVLAAIGHWYNDCEIAVEYAAAGVTTGDELRWVIDYSQIYRWRHLDRVSNTMTQHIHWITNTRTREDGVNRLSEALLDHMIEIRNVHAIEEMRDFGRYEGEGKAAGIDNTDDYVMGHIICICASHQTGKRQELGERMGMGTNAQSPTASALMPVVPKNWIIVDAYGRQIQDHFVSEKAAQDEIDKCQSKVGFKLPWSVKPVVVMAANTCYSPIYDRPDSAEGQLYAQGMKDKHVLPDAVAAMRDVLTSQHYLSRTDTDDE
jgi:hypothetical protein